MSLRILDSKATAAALPMGPLIQALRERFAQGCQVPARAVHQWADGQGGQVTSLLMPAWVEGEHYGVKVVNVAPGNAGRGLPGVNAAYLLFDASTGVPRAVLDGDQITLRRTVAASALAASFLAPPEAEHLLVVGAGRIAELLPWAHAQVRPIQRVSVWARRPEQAQALASRWQQEGLQAQAVQDLARAATQADIISCATLAREPVVRGAWLRAGQHLDLIGSFTPEMREADDDCWRGARCYVDVQEALVKSGDLLGPLHKGVLSSGDVLGDLQALCRGEVPGRLSAEDRTVFKSVGTALEDLAAAALVWKGLAAA